MIACRRVARTAGREEDAYRAVEEAVQIKCGIPVEMLGPEAETTFRRYHGIQWRAYIWGGKIDELDEGIKRDPDRHFLKTVDWVYRGSNGGAVKRQLEKLEVGFDRNF